MFEVGCTPRSQQIAPASSWWTQFLYPWAQERVKRACRKQQGCWQPHRSAAANGPPVLGAVTN